MNDYLSKLSIWWVALAMGLVLMIVDSFLGWMSFLPTYADFIGETIWVAVIAAIVFFMISTRSIAKGLVAIVLLVIGYWMIPNVGSTIVYAATRDHFTGTITRQYLDQTEDEGTRNIFVIQRHDTCEEESYIAKDEIIFAFGIWPLVYQDDSQVTRDTLISMEGQSVEIWEVHTRRYKRDMPILGKIGGTVTAFFGADWSAFPNIFGVQPSSEPNPCK